MRKTGSAYLPWLILAAVAVAGASLKGTGRPASRAVASPAVRATPKHYVTPRQLAESNAMVLGEVESLEAVDQDDRRLDWKALSEGGKRPVVLIFVKEGCPCNLEFEPFFARVERLYRDEARFAEVIDAGPDAARRHAKGRAIAHPVLSDPDRRIIHRFRAENGGYLALLTPAGVLDGFWPGCSADGLKELGRRIARVAGTAERPLDLTGMPGPLTTGCPFE